MKIGLVLEGGGLRGVYTQGVLDALMDAGWQADYVVGVSAGANNGAYYVSGQRGEAFASILNHIGDKRYLSLENYVRSRSVFGMDFIFNEIPLKLSPMDFDTLLSSPCAFEIGVTDVETGKAVFFDKSRLSGGDTTVLRASSSIPCFAPMVEYGGRLYLDGGTAAPIPVNRALEVGCRRLVIVRTRPENYIKSPEHGRRLYRTLYRSYPRLIRCIDHRHREYNACAALSADLKARGQAVIIAPARPLPVARFEKSAEKLRLCYQIGLRDGRAALPALAALDQARAASQ